MPALTLPGREEPSLMHLLPPALGGGSWKRLGSEPLSRALKVGMEHRDKTQTETRTHLTPGYMALIPILQIKALRLQRRSRFPWVTGDLGRVTTAQACPQSGVRDYGI